MKTLLLLAVLIAGTVVDRSTGDPIQGASLAAGDRVAVTDSQGRFAIEVDGPLIVSAAGYQADTIDHPVDGIRVELKPRPYDLEQMVVRTVRGGQGTQGAAATLDQASLGRGYAGQEVPAVLTDAPSVQVATDAGVPFGYTYLRLRGIDQSRINVTVDGIPMNEPEDHGVYFSNMPGFASSVHSVQVQRGAGTTAFGGATFAGALHFETDPLSAPAHRNVSMTAGSHETTRVSVAGGTGVQPGEWAALGRVSAHTTEGFRDHSGSRSVSYFAKAGRVRLDAQWMVTAFGGASGNDMAYLAVPRSVADMDPTANPLTEAETDAFQQHVVVVAHTRRLGRWSWATKVFHNRIDGAYGVLIDDLWTFDLEGRWTGAVTYVHGSIGPLRVDAGASGSVYDRRHRVLLPTLEGALYENTGERDEVAAFARGAFPLGIVTLHGDLQARHTAFRYRPDLSDPVKVGPYAWTFLNPRLGISTRLAEVAEVYALAGRTSREPARNDLFGGFDHVGSDEIGFIRSAPTVRPETVHDVEAGVRLVTERLQLHLNGFRMSFRDEIAPIGTLSYIGLPLRKNIEATRRSGFEAAWTHEVERAQWGGDLTWMAARIVAYTDDRTGVSYRDTRPLLTPEWSGSAWATVRPSDWWYVGLDLEGASRQQLDNTGSPGAAIPAYGFAGARAGAELGRLRLDGTVTNVLDQRVYRSGYMGETEPHVFPMAGRTLMVTAHYSF